MTYEMLKIEGMVLKPTSNEIKQEMEGIVDKLGK